MLYEPIPQNFKKANKSIKQALYNALWADTYYNREYWIKVCDQRVEFFCQKFNITPTQLFKYF